MNKQFILIILLIISTILLGQSSESLMKLTHNTKNISATIWNDGFIGDNPVDGKSGTFSWKGIDGIWCAGLVYGTSSVGLVNGSYGEGSNYIDDWRNYSSNFKDGLTKETIGLTTFDQVSEAQIEDITSPLPIYGSGFTVIQKSYSNVSEDVIFFRYGFINSTGDDIYDLYVGHTTAWDIGNNTENTGGVDLELNLTYACKDDLSGPYFGVVAIDSLYGCKLTTKIPSNLREETFNYISKIDTSIPAKGDIGTIGGTYIDSIAQNDTSWVTFAYVAGDNLDNLKVNAKRAIEVAASVGWSNKNIIAYSGNNLLNVPRDYSSIQEAINASVDGDTILVAAGTYFENIKFKGKAIIVASHFLMDGNETHIDETIINGSQPAHPDSGSVVSFHSGEDTTSVLYGFTITGGTGSISPPNSGYDAFGGGGISVAKGAGAKIHFNKITNNSVSYNNLAAGGGIIIDSPENRVVVKNNYITKNKIFSQQGVGGGIMCLNSQPEIILIAGNVISDNQINNGEGGGLYFDDSSVLVMNNLIKNNSSSNGIKIICHPDPGNYKMIFINNTVVYNEGEGLNSYSPNSTPQITNSIFWGNNPPFTQIKQELGHVSVSYSNIEGGFTGIGNIDLDPLFADTNNYSLDPLSPCSNAGHPDEVYNDFDGTRNDMGCHGGSVISTITDVEEYSVLLETYKLFQNYPNPFNPTTRISYSIPQESMVTIKVFDVLGKEVTTLIKKRHAAGNYQVELNANNLSSGVYFYNLQAGDYVDTKKMILLR